MPSASSSTWPVIRVKTSFVRVRIERVSTSLFTSCNVGAFFPFCACTTEHEKVKMMMIRKWADKGLLPMSISNGDICESSTLTALNYFIYMGAIKEDKEVSTISTPNGEKEQYPFFSPEDMDQVTDKKQLRTLLKKNKVDLKSVDRTLEYERELQKLQVELVKLQSWIVKKKKRVAVIFEGRDAAGKGGSVRRFKEHLNPRAMRVVALTKPTNIEKGQWYFRRYVKEMPNPGELVLFDRSWYNRAVVEPVMGFCTEAEYEKFMRQVPEYEHMLYEDGVHLIKFWFSISKEEQLKRFQKRAHNKLKQWKLSPVDLVSQEKWDVYTDHKERMFSKTHTSFSPWTIIKTNDKKTARLESIRHVLAQFDYDNKSMEPGMLPDPNVVLRYHRSILQLDQ